MARDQVMIAVMDYPVPLERKLKRIMNFVGEGTMLRELPLAQLPCLVLDIETTGLDPQRDEIIEVGAVVLRPGEKPKVVIDTLIKPIRGVRASDIHGITNNDVADAPSLAEVVPLLRYALANRVLVAHNAAFELRFLDGNKIAGLIPHLCTMSLGRAVLGQRRSLQSACFDLGVEERERHRAVDDAYMTAELFKRLILHGKTKGFSTPKAFESLGLATCDLAPEPLPAASRLDSASRRIFKSRRPRRTSRRSFPERDYLELVLAAVEDLEVSPDEIERVRASQATLEPAVVRALHARVFQAVLARYTEDRTIDDQEEANIRALSECLHRLGWSPGRR